MDDEARRMANSITAPLTIAQKYGKFAQRASDAFAAWQLGNLGTNLFKNNQTKKNKWGTAVAEAGDALNKKEITVKQACQNMASRGVSDEEITETIYVANRCHSEGFRYGEPGTRFATYRASRFNIKGKYYTDPRSRLRRGWKRKNQAGKEEWAEESESTLDTNISNRIIDQDLSEFEVDEGNNSGLGGGFDFAEDDNSGLGGGGDDGGMAGRGGLRGGGSGSKIHSTQSQSEEMKEDTDITQNRSIEEDFSYKSTNISEDKMAQDTPTVEAFAKEFARGETSPSSRYILLPQHEPQLITTQRLSFYQLPIVQFIVAGGFVAFYMYNRLKSLTPFKQQNIGDRSGVDKSFSAGNFQTAVRFIPWVESYDRKTRQDLYKVLLDFNSGSFTRKQAVFVLTNHFDLKEAEIDQLLEINSKKDEAS